MTLKEARKVMRKVHQEENTSVYIIWAPESQEEFMAMDVNGKQKGPYQVVTLKTVTEMLDNRIITPSQVIDGIEIESEIEVI